MNEVYTRLGEMTTTMKNLRDILDLGTVTGSWVHSLKSSCELLLLYNLLF